ncbi:MAG: response regulator transcription factor [Thermoanaerobacterales bacterium]|nr:response regulator transcription factor [Bacillota bacterium]MDI6905924.1 response regulator transcription factor [Thermoanaerobacterales bacterium]
MTQQTILVVDDEEPVQELARMYLAREGFRVVSAYDGEDALQRVHEHAPDLVVLDIMLPKLDGWTVCRTLRKELPVPIIMLSAKGEEYDRVLGLELGADDYITKPFSPRELVARVKAVLRRAKGDQGGEHVLTYGPLTIDYQARRVDLDGQEITLAPKEFDLLWTLAGHPGRVFSRDQLLSQVWGYDYFGDPRTVDTHVKRLREKLRGGGANYIKTVWGLGYRFEVPS